MMSTIALPWPSRTLHPNSRPHWAALHKAKAKAKAEAYVMTRYLRECVSEPILVTVTMHPPRAGRRDVDGAVSACKAYFDGIADAIGIDDSRWKWRLPSEFAEPRKGGAVVVAIVGGAE